MSTFPYRGKHPGVAEDDAIQKKRDSKYNTETKKREMAKKISSGSIEFFKGKYDSKSFAGRRDEKLRADNKELAEKMFVKHANSSVKTAKDYASSPEANSFALGNSKNETVRGTTRTYENRKKNLHKYLTGGK